MNVRPTVSVAPRPARVLECRICGASLELDETIRSTTCAFCASPNVIEREPTRGRPEPTFAIGFRIDHAEAETRVRRWGQRQGTFRRADLHRAQIAEIRGVYVPAYLYSAAAHSDYAANIGEYYWVTETYTVVVNGRRETRTRQVRHTEWIPMEGRHAIYVSDVLVTASRGLTNVELTALEPFDLRELCHYAPELVSGWLAEEATLDLAASAELARREAVDSVGPHITRFLPGDTTSDVRWRTQLEHEAFALTLLPIWVLALRYDEKSPPLRILVNGQTGEVVGVAPWSTLRIAIAIGMVVILFLLFFLRVTGRL